MSIRSCPNNKLEFLILEGSLLLGCLCWIEYMNNNLGKSKCSFQYNNSLADSEEVRRPISIDSINWDSELEANTANQTTKKNCRNSVQGREVIVDERGK